MSATHDSPLMALSSALSTLVAAASSTVVGVKSPQFNSSGFIWKPGLIVTANDALAEEGDISVTLAGGKTADAKLVGRDPSTDIALLQIADNALSPAALEATVPPAGALALGLSSRGGLPVAACGIVAVSGPAWQSVRVGDIDARLELDLVLNRSGEGGLAFDAAGRAFGMTVFGPRRRVLVIPAATISRVAARLQTDGKIPRGYLGLGLQPVSIAAERGAATGAMVMSVDSDGPGAQAGIQQGDIIAKFAERPIGSIAALMRMLGPASVGTVLPLELRRAGTTVKVDLTIGERRQG